jgi:uncharacterized protein
MAEVKAAQHQRRSPLGSLAALHASFSLVELLLAHGAEVDVENEEGKTALHYAVEKSSDLVKLLLAHKPQLEARGKDNITPLQQTVINRNLEISSGSKKIGRACQ